MDDFSDISSGSSSESENEQNPMESSKPRLHGRKAMMAAHANDEDFIVSKKNPITKGKGNKRRGEGDDNDNNDSGKEDVENAPFKNRQRVMLLCSRGITQRYSS